MPTFSRRQFIRVVGGTAFAYPSLAAFTASRAAVAMPKTGVLVEAESFADPGGWKRDPQFVEQMGGVYLLAHGLGTPVENAKTKVHFAEPGRYRMQVRTKDWCPPEKPGQWQSPGRFKVHVNGNAVVPEFGTEPGWGWQDGGWVDIDSNDVEMQLQDLTGFGARCDAIYFCKDAEYTPPNDTLELIQWKDQAAGRTGKPDSEHDFDLVIVGGGIAGCGAAMAADSQGLKVALIQDRPVLGGNASSEIRVHTLGVHGKSPDILKQLDTKHWQNGSAESFADDKKRHENMAATSVEVFFEHRACGLELDGKKITCVDARQTGTGVITRFNAPLFIDCTGDGWIGHWAGAQSRYGRESKDEFNEGWDKHGDLWAPATPDNKVMGTSVLWNTAKTKQRVDFPEVPWAMPVAKNHNETRGDWNWEYSDDDLNQIDDAEHIRDHMFRAIYGTFWNAKQDPRNATLALTWVAHIGGKRESRRLMGDYMFTMQDAVKGTTFPDTVVEETRELDTHYQLKEQGYPVDFRSKALFYKTPRYYLPFRCLYSKDVPNLMMAGRCFSCSHIGLSGPRVQNTTGQMGIATGYAAVVCKKHNATPREVGKNHIDELRSLIGYS